MSAPSPSSPSSGPSSSEKTAKTWQVGTLTYTTGGIIVIFCWLLFGDFAWSMRERSVTPMASWYLNDIGVPSVLFGLLIASFPAALSLVLGPIISVKSDRHRSKRGRRIPFLLITTPVSALGMLGLSITPPLAKWLHQTLDQSTGVGGALHRWLDQTAAGAWVLGNLQNEMFVALVCFGVFWTAFELGTVASYPVFQGLVNDVVPKPLLGRFYGLFRAIHLLDGIIFNYWIMGKVPTHFTLILASISFFYGLAFMWVCLRVKEGDYPPPPPPPAPAPGEKNNLFVRFGREVAKYCRECFASSYYLSVLLLLMFGQIAFSPINIYAIPYARSLNLDMEVYGESLALTYLISLTLSYPIGWMVDKFHPLRVATVALVGYVAVTAWGSFFISTPKTFLVAWVMHGVLSGCYFTTAVPLAQRLLPHSKFAQFYSAALSCIGLGNIVVVPFVGVILDVSSQVYRYTYVASCSLAAVSLVAALIVRRQFLRLGGYKAYVAPGSDDAPEPRKA